MFSFIGWLFYAGLASFLYWLTYALGLFADQVTACVVFIAVAAFSIIVTIRIEERITTMNHGG